MTNFHKLFLCVRHETIDLSAIPVELGMPACYLVKSGEPRTSAIDGHQYGAYPKSYCSIEFGHFDQRLSESLEATLHKLRPHSHFLEQLSASGAELRLIINWYSEHGSFTAIEWQQLREAADLKISLDFYCYRGTDETRGSVE